MADTHGTDSGVTGMRNYLHIFIKSGLVLFLIAYLTVLYTSDSAKNIPMQTLLGNPDKYLKKDKEYYLVCQSGGRSSMACNSLRQKGFNVINVAGGVGSYLGKHRS